MNIDQLAFRMRVAFSLHTAGAGGSLVTDVRRGAVNILASVIVACVGYAPWLVTPSHLGSGRAQAKRSPANLDVDRTGLNSNSEDDSAVKDVPDAVDLYGNEVTDAVAKYQLDETGTLYELHSPQTEVPRLKPPKT
jgi:hypothetical protein